MWPGLGSAVIGKGGDLVGNTECISLETGDGALPSGWFGSPETGHEGGQSQAMVIHSALF